MLYQVNILNQYDDLKDWDDFVDLSPQGCIFCKSFWLKSVCPNGFNIVVVENNNTIMAGIPLRNEYNEKGEKIVNMPLLTQTMGILLWRNIKSKYCKYLSEVMKVVNLIIDELENYKSFYTQFHYNFTNWLPFFWKGYKQTTRYTYIIDLINLKNIFSNFTYAKRSDIKKSQKIVEILTDIKAEDFYNHHENSLKKNDKKIRYSFNWFCDFYNKIYNKNCGKSWYSVDKDGNIYSIIFVVFDSKSAYYLVSSIDPDYRKIGSTSLLIWEAIKYSFGKVEKWDFEGSIRKNIEQSYRQFGGIQTPYFLITR